MQQVTHSYQWDEFARKMTEKALGHDSIPANYRLSDTWKEVHVARTGKTSRTVTVIAWNSTIAARADCVVTHEDPEALIGEEIRSSCTVTFISGRSLATYEFDCAFSNFQMTATPVSKRRR